MASIFKHDNQGFLVGELLDVNRELLNTQSAGMAVWRGIRSDVKAIAKVLGAQVRNTQAQQRDKAASQPRAIGGQFSRTVDQPAGRAGAAMAPSGSTAGPGRATSGTAEITTRATVSPAGRNARGQFVGASKPSDIETRHVSGLPVSRALQSAGRDTFTTAVQPAGRDGRGRFAQGDADSPDKAGRDDSGKLTNAIQKLSASLDGAEQLDPTITALKEIKDTVSPLGRGMFSMFGRGAERKKEVWYKRLLKAITGKKEGYGSAIGGRGEESGGLLSTLLTAGLSRAFLPVIAAIGTAIVAMAPVVGAALAVALTAWLIKKALETPTAKEIKANFEKGLAEQTNPVKYAPPVLDASGRNVNDPRRIDRKDAVGADGRAINDPRRIDLALPESVPVSSAPLKRDRLGRTIRPPSYAPAPGAELPPATSIAQSAGRFVGGIRKLLGVDGTKRMYENDDGSAETRSGGSVSWRNNNPGNLKLEYAGSADPTVKTKRTKAQALKSAQSRYDGVVDLDQFGNVIFATEEAGRAAKAKLLTGTHGNKTIENMLPDYAKDDYSGRSNHATYAAGIYKMADAQGVNLRGKKIGDMNQPEMSALLDGMKKVEGFKVGSVATLGAVPSMPTVTAGAARIPPVVIPSSTPERIAPAPDAAVPAQLNTTKQAPVNVSMREAIGQDVGDRSIAHVVSGGLGMMA